MTLKLKSLRKNKNLTAEDVAKQLGITRGYYSHLENGTRDFTEELIDKTAEVLDVKRAEVAEIAKQNKANNVMHKSWIFNIHIDGKPLLNAFGEYLEQKKLINVSNNDIVNELSKFITYRIEYSVREELNNEEIIDYIIRKLSLQRVSTR